MQASPFNVFTIVEFDVVTGGSIMMSLAHIRKEAYKRLSAWRRAYLNTIWGMDIGVGSRISSKAFLDYAYPKGIHIGSYCAITPGVRIFTHDHVNGGVRDTYIGSHCFIGANALIMPGVRIGDHCIVAAGAVVTRDVPSHSMVAGNPAKTLRSGIMTKRWGHLAKSPPTDAIAAAPNSFA